jgi:hypothetical protein
MAVNKELIEYLLLAESDPVELSLNVNRHLENGWVLYGNPSIQAGPQNSLWHYQAIVHNTIEKNLQQPTTEQMVGEEPPHITLLREIYGDGTDGYRGTELMYKIKVFLSSVE